VLARSFRSRIPITMLQNTKTHPVFSRCSDCCSTAPVQYDESRPYGDDEEARVAVTRDGPRICARNTRMSYEARGVCIGTCFVFRVYVRVRACVVCARARARFHPLYASV